MGTYRCHCISGQYIFAGGEFGTDLVLGRATHAMDSSTIGKALR
jgi:hypothetical protein